MKKNGADKIVVAYTDGASRGNPGPSAGGIVISSEQLGVKEYGEYFGETTNNIAEYRAVIFALKKIKQLLGKNLVQEITVEVNLDSELVARQLRGEYRVLEKDLFEWFIAIWNLRQDFKAVEFKIISRVENGSADRMANQALDEHFQKSRQRNLL